MISKKEQQVMALGFDKPKEFDGYLVRNKRRRNEHTILREQHMLKMYNDGVSVAQIARVYRISRQRAHQIIKSMINQSNA